MNNWSQLNNPQRVSTATLLLVIIDFLKSFESKLFPSTKKADFATRSKPSMRRKALMCWTIRFLKLLKGNEEMCSAKNKDVISLCYMRIAKIFVN